MKIACNHCTGLPAVQKLVDPAITVVERVDAALYREMASGRNNIKTEEYLNSVTS